MMHDFWFYGFWFLFGFFCASWIIDAANLLIGYKKATFLFKQKIDDAGRKKTTFHLNSKNAKKAFRSLTNMKYDGDLPSNKVIAEEDNG